MDRQEIYKVLDGERDYQDKKWGGQDHDQQHSPGDFILYMESHLNKAKETLYSGSMYNTLEQLRKVSALSIACFEIFGVPERMVIDGVH